MLLTSYDCINFFMNARGGLNLYLKHFFHPINVVSKCTGNKLACPAAW